MKKLIVLFVSLFGLNAFALNATLYSGASLQNDGELNRNNTEYKQLTRTSILLQEVLIDKGAFALIGAYDIGLANDDYAAIEMEQGDNSAVSWYNGGLYAYYSTKKAFGINYGGIIQDISAAVWAEHGNQVGKPDMYYGPSIAFNTGGALDALELEVFAFDDRDAEGVGSLAFLNYKKKLSASAAHKFILKGWFLTQVIPQNDDDNYFFQMRPQFLYDLGNNLWREEGKLQAGLRWDYLYVRDGIVDDVTGEKLDSFRHRPQIAISYTF